MEEYPAVNMAIRMLYWLPLSWSDSLRPDTFYEALGYNHIELLKTHICICESRSIWKLSEFVVGTELERPTKVIEKVRCAAIHLSWINTYTTLHTWKEGIRE